MPNTLHLDANELIFFARQLEFIKARTYDVVYPELKARPLIPVSFEAGNGATSITYRQYDQVGMAKIIANYARDLPRASVKGKEFTSIVKSLGSSYGYSVQDIRSAAKAGVNLAQREANAAKRAIMQKETDIAFFGDAEYNLPGFFSNANIPSAAVPADGVGASTLWSAKTPDQIIRDVNELINDIITVTKGAEAPNTVLLPISRYTLINTTPRSEHTDTTILQFLKMAHPAITMWDWLNELETAGPGSEAMMTAYNRSPDKLTLEIPSDFEQFPEQSVGLEFEVPCHERIGGTIVYYPLSANMAYGI